MKRFCTILLCLLGLSYAVAAQDIITLKSNQRISAKVMEITPTEVKYKRSGNPDGPTYTLLKTDVLSIKYENGTEETLNVTDSDKIPGEVFRNNSSVQMKTVDMSGFVPDMKAFRSRMGFVLGGGAGFESIPVITLTDGSEASISFGGGVLVQFELGYRFNRHFDLAFNAGGQYSELDKAVKDCSVDFNRSIVSLTPSYVIPFGAKRDMSFKIGAGLDYIFNAELNIDTKSIPNGFTDVWKYTGGLGEHFSIIYTFERPYKRLSYNAGMAVYNVNYEFKSGGSYHPTEDKLIKPNGAGINFTLSIFYNFNWMK